MSGGFDRARPDLRPKPDEVLDLGAAGLPIFRDWRFGDAMHRRCHVAGDIAVHSEDVEQVSATKVVDVPTRPRMKFATRRGWAISRLAMRSRRSNAARASLSMAA